MQAGQDGVEHRRPVLADADHVVRPKEQADLPELQLVVAIQSRQVEDGECGLVADLALGPLAHVDDVFQVQRIEPPATTEVSKRCGIRHGGEAEPRDAPVGRVRCRHVGEWHLGLRQLVFVVGDNQYREFRRRLLVSHRLQTR